MPWQIRLLPKAPPWEERRVGDAWFADDAWTSTETENYRANNAGRKMLFVTLPSKHGPEGLPFCVDGPASRDSVGWVVTGVPPMITVSPSINVIGDYHGFIQAGVITDDCEGRKFDDK